jgi:hypothetical protein
MPLFIDAKGLLLSLVPIILRINVYIVNIDTSNKARNKPDLNPITILENKASY